MRLDPECEIGRALPRWRRINLDVAVHFGFGLSDTELGERGVRPASLARLVCRVCHSRLREGSDPSFPKFHIRNPKSFSGLGDSTRADAVCTNPHTFVGLSNNDPYALKVRIPPPSRQIMSMTDPIPIDRALVTDFAARHEGNLLL